MSLMASSPLLVSMWPFSHLKIVAMSLIHDLGLFLTLKPWTLHKPATLSILGMLGSQIRLLKEGQAPAIINAEHQIIS